MSSLLHIIELLGLVAFATSGALVASRHVMDVFGGVVLAFVTGVGGGTLRDLVLDQPVFWLTAPDNLWACVAGFVLALVILRTRGAATKRVVNLFDALGLAVFSVLGAQKALALDHSMAVAVIMGVLTGCGGGVLRDVLANEIPVILSRQRLYATASLAAALLYTVLAPLTSPLVALGAGLLAALVIRIGAMFFDWRLPLLPKDQDENTV